MAFRYSTEYHMGRGCVRRDYSGPRALIAIAFDLTLAFVFGLIGLAARSGRFVIVTICRVAWFCVVATYRVVAELLGLPLRLIRFLSAARSGRGIAKPSLNYLGDL